MSIHLLRRFVKRQKFYFHLHAKEASLSAMWIDFTQEVPKVAGAKGEAMGERISVTPRQHMKKITDNIINAIEHYHKK